MTADLSADRYAAWNQAKLTGAYNFTGGIYGSVNQVETDQTNTSNAGVMVGSYGAAYNYKKTVSSANGAQGRVTNAGTGTIASTNALYGIVANSGTGTIINAYGLGLDVVNQSTGTIINAYGLGLDVVNQSTGTITNAYGLYLGSVQGTNKWSLYQSDSAAPSFFAGYVGLGRSNPGARLEISATTEVPLISRALRDSIGLSQRGSGSIYTDWYVSDAASGQKFWRAGNYGGNFIFETVNDAYSATTGEKMRILGSNGYVGIGTASPGAKLEVAGVVSASGLMVAADGGAELISQNDEDSYIDFRGNSNLNADYVGRIQHKDTWGMYFYVSASTVPSFAIRNSGNVGIGTTAPTAKLHIVSGNNSLSDGILLEQTGTGGRKYTVASRENGKFVIGDETSSTARLVIDSSGRVGIGTYAPNYALDVYGSANVSSGMYFNYGNMRLSNDGSNTFWYNTTGYSLFYNSVGSGSELAFRFHGKTTNNPLFDLYNNGSATLYGTLTQTSDARLKTDIKPLTGALDKVSQLEGVSFHWKDTSKSKAEQIGLVAQNVKKVYPQLVSADASGTLSVNYPGMVAPLIQSVKELKDRNDHLEARVAELEALVARLTSGTQPTRH